MVNKHNIEIFVSGERLDLGDNTSIRLNNEFFNPTKLTATTSTYSYNISLPKTPTNNRILGNINASSKSNKFTNRHEAQVYADSLLIFDGSMKVDSIEQEEYSCNLYIPKVMTIEKIFGDSTMNELDWFVPFEGTSTMNEINANPEEKYYFPLVMYHVPNKVPQEASESGYRKYTDKNLIDEYSRWYFNSFVPSLNLSELMKRVFKSKNLELRGDIVSNPIIKEIYLSNFIDSGQDPLYNYANPKIGELSFSISFKNYKNGSGTNYNKYNYPLNNAISYIGGYDIENVGGLITWDSPFWVNGFFGTDITNPDTAANEWLCYNLLDLDSMGGETNLQVSLKENCAKLMVNGGIQIPADGFYEISIDGNIYVESAATTLDMKIPNIVNWGGEKTDIYPNVVNMPVEFQLLRYNATNNDMESINHNTMGRGAYPNEASAITNSDGTISYYSDRLAPFWQYNYLQASTVAVDEYNNPNYLCGFQQSMNGISLGYLKNDSWNMPQNSKFSSLYNSSAYYKCVEGNGSSSARGDNTNRNSIGGSYNQISNIATNQSNYSTSGELRQIVHLQKNDVIIPYLNIRRYENENKIVCPYAVGFDGDFKIRAVMPENKSTKNLGYGMKSLFDYDLNLGNFLNSGQKMSEFVSGIQKAFNLDFQHSGNIVTMNRNKQVSNLTYAAVDIDNRVNTKDAIFNSIDFPSYINVKFNVDTEEEGFYLSVPYNRLEGNNWVNYGDYGSDKIQISPSDDATELEQVLMFSYNWFKPMIFKLEDGGGVKYNVPVIGKNEWWIEGYKYEEMSNKDGRSMKQRMWFRAEPNEDLKLKVNLSPLNKEEYYYVDIPSNYKKIGGEYIYLNYKDGYNTLLGKFFNINIDSSSDEVEIDTYLSPLEYKAILEGSSIHFDSDVYSVESIQGYDPEGFNKTKLSLIKKRPSYEQKVTAMPEHEGENIDIPTQDFGEEYTFFIYGSTTDYDSSGSTRTFPIPSFKRNGKKLGWTCTNAPYWISVEYGSSDYQTAAITVAENKTVSRRSATLVFIQEESMKETEITITQASGEIQPTGPQFSFKDADTFTKIGENHYQVTFDKYERQTPAYLVISRDGDNILGMDYTQEGDGGLYYYITQPIGNIGYPAVTYILNENTSGKQKVNTTTLIQKNSGKILKLTVIQNA